VRLGQHLPPGVVGSPALSHGPLLPGFDAGQSNSSVRIIVPRAGRKAEPTQRLGCNVALCRQGTAHVAEVCAVAPTWAAASKPCGPSAREHDHGCQRPRVAAGRAERGPRGITVSESMKGTSGLDSQPVRGSRVCCGEGGPVETKGRGWAGGKNQEQFNSSSEPKVCFITIECEPELNEDRVARAPTLVNNFVEHSIRPDSNTSLCTGAPC
jgi:hypothetical protein